MFSAPTFTLPSLFLFFSFFFKKNFIYKSFSKKYKLNIPLIYYQQTPQNIKLPFSGNVSVLINTTLSILSDWTFSLLQPFSLLNISTQLFFLKSLKTIEKLERFWHHPLIQKVQGLKDQLVFNIAEDSINWWTMNITLERQYRLAEVKFKMSQKSKVYRRL